MKIKNKFIKVISLVFSIALFVSCSEENPIESTLTSFPTFEVESVVVVALDGAFTPGAKATEGGKELSVAISGSADTSTVGVYDITYSATNSDGFDGSVSQKVIVHDPSIVGTDVSGAIADLNRPARTGVISLVEGTTSIFFVTDFAYGGTFPVYFQMDGDAISDIPQAYVFGNDHIDLTYDSGALTFTVYIPEIDFLYSLVTNN